MDGKDIAVLWYVLNDKPHFYHYNFLYQFALIRLEVHPRGRYSN